MVPLLLLSRCRIFKRCHSSTKVARMRLFLPRPRKSRFLNGTEILAAKEYFFGRENVKNPKVNMPSPTRPNEWGKCSFSVNLAGVGGNRRAQLEIGSKHCAENAHSGLMYIFHLKRLSSSCVARTYKQTCTKSSTIHNIKYNSPIACMDCMHKCTTPMQ